MSSSLPIERCDSTSPLNGYRRLAFRLETEVVEPYGSQVSPNVATKSIVVTAQLERFDATHVAGLDAADPIATTSTELRRDG